MVANQEELYDIAFAGECLGGHDVVSVRRALGVLFKADETTLDRLFSGTRQSIKRHCDRATALKYQKSLAKAGAKAIVTRANIAETADAGGTARAASPPAIPSSKQRDDASSTASEALTLLPGGSDILRPDERAQPEGASVDLSHLSLAEAGEPLGDDTQSSDATVIAVPEFEVAEAGARMTAPDDAAPIAAPDTSALNLAPVGEDLTERGDIAPAPTVSTDHLNLADAGSDLLRADERQASDAEAPNTSHIKLNAPANPFDT